MKLGQQPGVTAAEQQGLVLTAANTRPLTISNGNSWLVDSNEALKVPAGHVAKLVPVTPALDHYGLPLKVPSIHRGFEYLEGEHEFVRVMVANRENSGLIIEPNQPLARVLFLKVHKDCLCDSGSSLSAARGSSDSTSDG